MKRKNKKGKTTVNNNEPIEITRVNKKRKCTKVNMNQINTNIETLVDNQRKKRNVILKETEAISSSAKKMRKHREKKTR